ncbi:arabinogalactan oligomer/maltooligosaccharide transport system substrate-binding protein [Halorubrum trapanicum]|uniref:Maltodextrin-binding protein n=1 Tax=Halorubrum trapanicum TaxID=29284 RepID=A0A8J7UNU9_9EURY|nr:extracellular solute-binding protein [Halorubrum trapanicum]MBP1902115.1 arabinogalactan oligomer/maltooligosaccharide transport system substrate-binding protein [Halorubrum trapanicum]
MNEKRRTLLKTMGGSTALAALAGCISTGGDGGDGSDSGNGSDGGDGSDGGGGNSGSARLWADLTDAEDEDMDAYISDFEEESGYIINKEAPGGELDQQLETAIPAGDGPDSWIWAHDWVGRFAVREDPPFLYDASDDVDVSLDSYTETAQQAAQFDGGLYGLPFASETAALYYNADMVEEPPETLEEMVSVMEEHHDPENGQYGLSFPGVDPYQASGFIQAYGGDLFDEENLEVTVDSDACKRGMDALETLYEYMPADPGYESQIVAFSDGLAPFAINGPWELGNLQSEVDNLGVTTLPTVDGNNPRSYSGVQLFYFSSMLADADQSTVDAATGLAEWYTTNPEIIRSNAESQGYIPVLGEVVESGDVADEVQAFAQQVEHGVPMPSHPDMDSVWTPVTDALERVFNGDQESDAALDQAASEIREAL